MPPKHTFKVIIAGGSIAGLTLANMLEKFNLDYILLDSHSCIAPAVGASIGMFPNGLRILDQIGCHEAIEAVLNGDLPYDRQYTRDEEGNVIASIEGFYRKIEERYFP
jgi:2-polyprenyl-6-methoxyphenol hydroxylase-like FAD-dependent oxidoreductase